MSYTAKHGTNDPLQQILKHLEAVTRGRGVKLVESMRLGELAPKWTRPADEQWAYFQARNAFTSANQYLALKDLIEAGKLADLIIEEGIDDYWGSAEGDGWVRLTEYGELRGRE